MQFAKVRKEAERERIVGEEKWAWNQGEKEKVGRTSEMEQMKEKQNKER